MLYGLKQTKNLQRPEVRDQIMHIITSILILTYSNITRTPPAADRILDFNPLTVEQFNRRIYGELKKFTKKLDRPKLKESWDASTEAFFIGLIFLFKLQTNKDTTIYNSLVQTKNLSKEHFETIIDIFAQSLRFTKAIENLIANKTR